MKLKKRIGLGLAVMTGVLAIGAVCAMADDDVVKLRIHTLVPEQQDAQMVMDELNAYTREKIGVEVEYVFHGGSYADKIQTIIASGEEYDACFTSNWLNSYTTNVAKGAYLDIKDLVPEVAPKLLEVLPEYMWTAATINGGVYAVPNQQIVARQTAILCPKEYIEGTGTSLDDIKNFTAIKDYAQKAFDEYGAKLGGINVSETSGYCGYEFLNDYLSAGAIKMDDETATVVNFYATDEYKSMLEELAVLSEAGLLDGECGYMLDYCESQRLAKKTSAYFGGTYKPGVEAEDTNRCGYDAVDGTVEVPPYISTGSVIATMFGISATSKHPEETLKYLELVNTDPYVMNLVCYGIEGVHWNWSEEEEGKIETAPNSGFNHGMSWAMGNVFNCYPLVGQDLDVWEQTENINNSAKTSPLLGFSFDPEPVKMEITNVSKVSKEYESLVGGELPVEETLDEFLEKLEVAGVDTVIAEMQKQVDEFMASK